MKKIKIAFLFCAFIILGYGVSNIGAADTFTYDDFYKYNVILTGNHTAEQADIEGALALKGDLNSPSVAFQSFSVAASNDDYSQGIHVGPSFDPNLSPALLIGGEVADIPTGSSLSVLGEQYGVGDFDPSKSISSIYGSTTISQTELNDAFDGFADVADGLLTLTQSLTPNGQISPGAGSLSGTDFEFETAEEEDQVAVANVVGTDITFSEYNISSEVNEKDLIVVYSDATSVTFEGGAALYDFEIIDTNSLYNEGNLMTELASKTIFLFPNATSVNVNNYGVIGSVIAPNATIVGDGGAINGQIYATNLEQKNGFEAHNFIVDVDLTGDILINKTDQDGNPLEGVEIGLYYADDDTLYDSYTTDENGQIVISDVPLGKYYLKEITAPPGYELSTQEVPVTITPFTNEFTFNFVNNSTLGSIAFTKIDSSTGAPLPSVDFDVYDENDNYITTVTTDENGYAEINDLDYGNYYLVESAPDGYYSQNRYNFTINEDSQYLEYTIENFPYGSVSLCKEDGNTGELLEGAQFTLTRVQDGSSQILTTDSSGCLSATDLEYGVYKIEETTPPPHSDPAINYLNDGFVKFFYVGDAQQDYTYTAQNYPDAGYATLTKVDGDTGETLEGVSFELYDDNDNLIGTYTTDSNGEIVMGPLPLGDYYITEISTVSGYVLETEPYYFTISKELNEISFTLSNYKEAPVVTGNVTVSKVDTNGNGLEGAVIGLFDTTDTEIDRQTTDSNGSVTFTDIPLGDYYVQEITPPVGYELNDTKFAFSVSALENEYSFTIENIPLNGVLEVYKSDRFGNNLEGAVFDIYKVEDDSYVDTITTDENGYASISLPLGEYYAVEVTAPENYVPIEGNLYFTIDEDDQTYTYNLVDTIDIESILEGRIAIYKVDKETQEALPNVTFEIYDENNVLVDTMTTGDNGYAVSGQLPLGIYTVVESQGVDGYYTDDLSWTVELSDDDSFAGHMLVIENIKQDGVIEFQKVDQDSNPIEGAEFTIYPDTNDNQILDTAERTTPIETQTSDENGVVTFDELEYGGYFIVETKSADGYVVNDVPYYVEISQFNEMESFNFKNQEERGYVFVYKVDDEDNKLEGATFNIQGITDPSYSLELVTGEEGVAGAVLPLGDYVLTEIIAPEGYVLSDEEIYFTVDEHLNVQYFTMENEEAPQYGKAQIVKTDQFDDPVSNANFCVYQENPVDNPDAEAVECGVTDEDGIYETSLLEYGTYYLQEEYAPFNYFYNPEVVEFTIDEETPEQGLEVSFVNRIYDPSIEIYKVDGEDRNPLEGAEFVVYKDSNDNAVLDDSDELIVDDLVTDENGTISYTFDQYFRMIDENGDPIHYFIEETKAPEGYLIADEPLYISFGFTEDGETLVNPGDDYEPPVYLVEPSEETVFTIEVENEKDPEPEITDTGLQNTLLISIGGLTVALYAYSRYNRKY